MILLKNVRIFDGLDFISDCSDVLLSDGKITKIAVNREVPGARELDLSGKLLCPGFVDLHGHFREPGQTQCEDILSGARAAARGGFTVVVAMPNSKPAIDNDALVHFVADKGRMAAKKGGALVLPAGTVSIGRKGETMADLGDMANAGAVLFTDDGSPVKSTSMLSNAMLYASDLGIRIMEHPEELQLTNNSQVHEGRCSTLSGMKGAPAAAEIIAVARGIALARETGCAIHLTHISTAQAIEEIRKAKAEALPISCDVTPHHLVFSEEDVLNSHLSAVYKVNPPLRSLADQEALWLALADGTVDAIATDHAPWHSDEKDLPFEEAAFGIASYECCVAAVLDAWKSRNNMPLEKLLRLFTYGPASLLPASAGICGRIEEGAKANLTVLDLERELQVDTNNWLSKARMSPYNGRRYTAMPVLSIVEGELAYMLEEIRA